MLENRKVWTLKGYVPWQEATVHLMSHSVSRGSTIFEVLSVHATSRGAAVFRLDRHVERFFNTAKLLQMELPFDPSALTRAIIETVHQNGIVEGMVKVVGYYEVPEFGILPPSESLQVAVVVVDPQEDLGGLAFPFDTGTSACIASWRKLDPSTVPIQAKAAANYLNGMVARQESMQRGFESVILLDTQDFIAEGPTESIFLVQDNELHAPVLGTVLDSITRKSILTVAIDMGIAVRQQRLPKSMLFEADEIFFSGTPNKILPIRTIEDRAMSCVPGPLTQRLSLAMAQITAGKDPRYQNWLFPIDQLI